MLKTGTGRISSTYWKLIYSVARKAGLTEHEAEEVVQETRQPWPGASSFQYDRRFARSELAAAQNALANHRPGAETSAGFVGVSRRPRTEPHAGVERIPAPESLELDAVG